MVRHDTPRLDTDRGHCPVVGPDLPHDRGVDRHLLVARRMHDHEADLVADGRRGILVQREQEAGGAHVAGPALDVAAVTRLQAHRDAGRRAGRRPPPAARGALVAVELAHHGLESLAQLPGG